MTKQNFTAIAVIIDASGSMMGLTLDTIGSFNQFLTEQQALPGEAAFSLCTFNTHNSLMHDFVPLASASQLTTFSYRCNGGTALLDAMGTTIDSLGAKLAAMPEEERPSKVIVLVITDGEENSSHQFTADQVRAKVTLQRETYNWEFVFMGANIDAIATGHTMGFTAANSLNYDASAFGTQQLYSTVSSGMSSYRSVDNTNSQVDFFSQVVAPVPAAVVTGITAVPMTPVTGDVSGTMSTPTVATTFNPGHPLPGAATTPSSK